MLTQDFDQETERYWADLLAREQMTSEELLKTLIRERWVALQQASPVQTSLPLTPLASLPVPLGTADLGIANSTDPQLKPKNPKQTIAEFVRRKAR